MEKAHVEAVCFPLRRRLGIYSFIDVFWTDEHAAVKAWPTDRQRREKEEISVDEFGSSPTCFTSSETTCVDLIACLCWDKSVIIFSVSQVPPMCCGLCWGTGLCLWHCPARGAVCACHVVVLTFVLTNHILLTVEGSCWAESTSLPMVSLPLLIKSEHTLYEACFPWSYSQLKHTKYMEHNDGDYSTLPPASD